MFLSFSNNSDLMHPIFMQARCWLLVLCCIKPVLTFSQTFAVNGAALDESSGGDFIFKLTDDDGTSQTASVWNTSKHDWSTDFDETFNVYLGCEDASGADGITFSVQNDLGTTFVGYGGGGLGYGQIGTPSNMVTIEIDTWDNLSDGVVNDEVGDHIAVHLDGNPEVFVAGTSVDLGINIEDDNIHTFRVRYLSASTTLQIYFDGLLEVSTTSVDFASKFSSSSGQAYWGFTASTSTSSNEHWFSWDNSVTPPTFVDGCNVPLNLTFLNFDCHQRDGDLLLNWKAISDHQTDYYQLEGLGLSEVEIIEVFKYDSNRSAVINESFWVRNPEKFMNYRIKVINNNGSVNYSKHLSCSAKNVHNIQVLLNGVFVNFSVGNKHNDLTFNVFNFAGQLVYQSKISGTVLNSISTNLKGVYALSFVTSNGVQLHSQVVYL